MGDPPGDERWPSSGGGSGCQNRKSASVLKAESAGCTAGLGTGCERGLSKGLCSLNLASHSSWGKLLTPSPSLIRTGPSWLLLTYHLPPSTSTHSSSSPGLLRFPCPQPSFLMLSLPDLLSPQHTCPLVVAQMSLPLYVKISPSIAA